MRTRNLVLLELLLVVVQIPAAIGVSLDRLRDNEGEKVDNDIVLYFVSKL